MSFFIHKFMKHIIHIHLHHFKIWDERVWIWNVWTYKYIIYYIWLLFLHHKINIIKKIFLSNSFKSVSADFEIQQRRSNAHLQTLKMRNSFFANFVAKKNLKKFKSNYSNKNSLWYFTKYLPNIALLIN